MRKLIFIFSIIIIPLIILLANFRFYIFNEKYYENEFEKHGINKLFEKNDLKNRLDNILNFLKDKEEINKRYFNEREVLHLYDVKNLIKNSILILYVLVGLLVIFLPVLRDKKIILNAFVYGLSLTIVMLLFLFLITTTNFSITFLNFHYAAFSNDYWQLNAEEDKLILMFPEVFFYDISIRILFNSLILSIVLLILLFIKKSNWGSVN